MKRLAVLASGGGSNFQTLIDNIKLGKINAQIVVLIASNKNAYAAERAKANNIPVMCAPLKEFCSREQRDQAILKRLQEDKVDYVFLCGYLGILTSEFVSQYPYKIVNIHPSLLPSHGGVGMYGINVHQEVLRLKDPFTGATVHFVDEGTDTGAIIMQKSIPVLADDTPEILQQRVLKNCEHIILPKVAELLCNDRISIIDGKVVID